MVAAPRAVGPQGVTRDVPSSCEPVLEPYTALGHCPKAAKLRLRLGFDSVRAGIETGPADIQSGNLFDE